MAKYPEIEFEAGPLKAGGRYYLVWAELAHRGVLEEYTSQRLGSTRYGAIMIDRKDEMVNASFGLTREQALFELDIWLKEQGPQ